MMLNLEVCAHAWLYSRLLCYQLSSYILFPPTRANVKVTIFYCPDDTKTVEVLDWFSGQKVPPTVTWNFQPLEKTRLCRRAIGRNIACQQTTADWILLIDVDYFFGRDAIDTFVDCAADPQHAAEPLLFPRHVRVSKTHAEGDKAIERVTAPGIYWVEENDFDTMVLLRAIGGAQYVRGAVAREKGYLPNTRWQKRVRDWVRTYDDRFFRLSLGTPGTAIRLPNIFRIRHSARGRFDVGVEL